MPSEFFDFHGTRMRLLLGTAETDGTYALTEMHHPPNVGPALHIHPRGPESFIVLDGEYTLFRGTETLLARTGDAVVVPAGVPHRYTVGPTGGHVLVVTPPHLDEYFVRIAERARAVPPPSFEEERAMATAYGQDFVAEQGHWGG